MRLILLLDVFYMMLIVYFHSKNNEYKFFYVRFYTLVLVIELLCSWLILNS